MALVNDVPSPVAGLRLGSCGPVLISCFDDWPSGAMLSALAQAQLKLAETFPRIVSVTIIPAAPAASNAAMQMTDSDRNAAVSRSAALAEELKSITAANVVVILSRGLLAVMIRAFMAALGLVSGAGTDLKTFRTLEEAEAWLATAEKMPAAMPTGLAAAIGAWLEPTARTGTGVGRGR
jgi:hypothetical protein